MVLDKRDVNFVLLFLLIILSGLALLDFGFATTISNSTRTTVFVNNVVPHVFFANVTPNPAIAGQLLTYRANISDNNSDTLTVTIIYYNTTNKARSSTIKTSLQSLFYTNASFTVPADAEAGTWKVNATITDGFTTIVNKTSFTVSAVTSTKLQNTPVDFGNQTIGKIAQRAENGTAVTGVYTANIRGWPLIINNTGNTIVNYTINGTRLLGPTKVIGAGNITWNTTKTGEGSRSGKKALSATQTLINRSVSSHSFRRVYFWIDTPSGITRQRLNGTIVIVTNSQ